jgi:hypothetical protein
MKTRKALLFPISLILLFLTGCCAKVQESVQVFNVGAQPSNGNNLRLLSIGSAKCCFKNQEKEVCAKFETAINGGKYNIISIKTFYSGVYFTAAEITYDVSRCGDGNDLRVLLIQSDKNYYDEANDVIEPQLVTIINSGKYDVVKIQGVRIEGYLIAAEVYYRQRKGK